MKDNIAPSNHGTAVGVRFNGQLPPIHSSNDAEILRLLTLVYLQKAANEYF